MYPKVIPEWSISITSTSGLIKKSHNRERSERKLHFMQRAAVYIRVNSICCAKIKNADVPDHDPVQEPEEVVRDDGSGSWSGSSDVQKVRSD
jgi:hypothetical protein